MSRWWNSLSPAVRRELMRPQRGGMMARVTVAEHDPFELTLESAAFDAATWVPLPLPAATATTDAVPRLLAWAAGEGAWFEAIEIAVAADGNRTVHARHDVAAGEPLTVVPRHLMITDDDVGRHSLVGPTSVLEGTMLSPPCAIGLWVALEQAHRESPWRAYLDALPPAFPWLAVHLPAVQLAALIDTRALAMIAYKAHGHRADHELISRQHDALAALPLAEYTWGRQVSGSRCFRFQTARGGRRALVPVADMFDHGRADATWAYVDGPARFEVRAARDLGAGQEIQISYGRSGNASLVSTYGFAMADNGEDEALLGVATAAGVHHLAVGSHYDRRFQLAMAIAGPDGDDLAAMARIAAAARATIAAISKAPLAASGSPAWQASCQQVRAGEVATAAAIVEFVERVTAAGLIRSDAAWAEVIDSLEPAVTGAARMLRELAEASRADDA